MAQQRPVKWLPLARAIAAARMRAQMTQQQLADSIDKTVGFIGQLETGRRRGEAETLRRIARATGTPERELLTLAGYAIQEPEPGIPAPVLAVVRRLVATGLGVRQFEAFEAFAARFSLANGREVDQDDEGDEGVEDEGASDGGKRSPED